MGRKHLWRTHILTSYLNICTWWRQGCVIMVIIKKAVHLLQGSSCNSAQHFLVIISRALSPHHSMKLSSIGVDNGARINIYIKFQIFKLLRFCKIWGFHGGDYGECHLGCYTVWLL
jgi:hypothetical protein